VALETKGAESTAYVRGLQLIRQTKVNGVAAEVLFPLIGHLGTSLGAVDADGNLIEQVDSDVFGNFDRATGLKQTHLYTGEFWDQDTQLLYLRARWYDPSVGRFISADPFEGRQQDPRSLNRYSYAHGDPVHNTDPSGLFSLSELNTSINVQLTAVRQAFLSGGKQAGGKALQQLGKIVEVGVEKLIKQCLKPGAKIIPKKNLATNDGAKAVIDFFVKMGGNVKNIEVKYQLPVGSSSGGFARAAKQLQAMIDKGEEGLLIAYKQLKTDARAKKMLDSVSGNAGTVHVMEGFLGLGAFLGEMVIEGCIK
jgi:RHS repeat-associated protein